MNDLGNKPREPKKVKCPKCNGAKKINQKTCPTCNGTGKVDLLTD